MTMRRSFFQSVLFTLIMGTFTLQNTPVFGQQLYGLTSTGGKGFGTIVSLPVGGNTLSSVIPIDGVTTYNPEGLTMATGRHENAFAQRLSVLNMKCRTVSTTDYKPAMFEKLMYVAI